MDKVPHFRDGERKFREERGLSRPVGWRSKSCNTRQHLHPNAEPAALLVTDPGRASNPVCSKE